MRALYVLFAIIFVSLLLQCTDKNDNEHVDADESPNMVHITGYIHNRDVYPNTKTLAIIMPNVAGETSKIVTPVEKDGTFHFQFELNRPQDVKMETYLDFLYLRPNDHLHIELDFKQLMVAKLSRDEEAVKINEDFYKYFNQTFYRGSDYGVGTDCEMNCSLEEIIKKLDKQRVLNHERRSAFLEKTNVRKEVVFLTEAMIELDYYNVLISTMSRRDYYDKEIIYPETLMDEVNKKAIGYFSAGLYSDAHFKFIARAYTYLGYRIKPLQDMEFAAWARETACNDTIRNFMLATYASSMLIEKNLKGFEEVYSQIDMDYLLDRLMNEYQLAWDKMSNPEAISSSITGKKPKDFMSGDLATNGNLLAKAISPNIGKVQVIDIWTTWCSPCIKGFPKYKKLADEYAGQDVSFSFICAGGDEEKSHELLKVYGLGGFSNHFCTEAEYYLLAQTFSPIGFPYGILVNKKGVIVDYGFHVNPSMLREKIDLLLKQDDLIKK
ncbi:MAG: TlpA family protein disulfide reductase [Tannerella sp.]|jgi:thiol-disulfide isomerase/thioredoxin|nr:TlpA family protein disulfide reductase [Tannerella sp.]